MPIPVEMPKMSDTMEEGVLVAWLAEEGDAVSSGDIIAQVETDKATMDLEVYDDGVLLKRVIPEGASVPIGGLIAVLGKAGEDISGLLAGYDGAAGASATALAPEAPAPEAPVPETPAPSAGDGAVQPAAPQAEPETAVAAGDGRVKSSPLARRLAAEHSIALERIAGSGPEGRIVKRDIEAAIRKHTPAPGVAPGYGMPGTMIEMPAEEVSETVRISQMRKAIARRLSESKFTSPHFYLTVDVDVERAVAARARINKQAEVAGGVRISFNDLVTKACALALRAHPAVNASWIEQEGVIRQHGHVHVAVAVAIDDGLVTPVIRHADRKGLVQIASETRELAQRARDRTLQPEDWEGSTFTTSNLGMYGVEEFTAIINPPNACILAIGAIRDEAIAKEGVVVPGKRMKLTLSSDHRVVDGAVAAAFIGTVRSYLEEPLSMLL